MISRRTLLLSLLFVLLGTLSLPLTGIAQTGSGQTFYVDAQNGHDYHNGQSPNKAWKTVERANQQVFSPGDSLLFKNGLVYLGQLKPQAGQLELGKLVVASYGKGPKPTIDGQGALPAAIWLFNLQNVEVTGLRIVNQAKERMAKLSGIKVEINNYGTAKNIILRNLDIENVNGLLEKSKGGGCGILIQNGGNSSVSTFHGLLIEGCSIRRCERNGIIFDAYWSRQQWHPNLGVVIRNNVIDEVPGDGIVPIGCDGAVIEHNVMRNCSRLLPLGEAAAGIWPWSCDNTVVQFNEVSDHKAPWDGQGFDSDWNCRNTIIQYNYSHDNEGGFVLVCNDGTVNENYNAGNTGTIIRYNVSLNDGTRQTKTHAGVFSPVIHFAGPARGTQVYNNLIVHTGLVADTLDNRFIHMSSWGGMPADTWFTNNVIVSHTPTQIDLANCSGIGFANNLFEGVFQNLPALNGNISSTSVGHLWQSAYFRPLGFEGLLKFKIGNDFKGLGKGIAVDGMPSTDFYGKAINPNALNIGVDQSSPTQMHLPQ